MIEAGPGLIGVCPLPGRFSPFLDDLASILEWNPAMIVSLTETAEMTATGADNLGKLLQPHGIGWSHLPIRDYGAPDEKGREQWPALSQCLHTILENDGSVLLHCYGGQGRSGKSRSACWWSAARPQKQRSPDYVLSGPARSRRMRSTNGPLRPTGAETAALGAYAIVDRAVGLTRCTTMAERSSTSPMRGPISFFQ